MKVVWTVLVIVLLAGVICWVREGAGFSVLQALPLLGGHAPGLFDVGGVALIVITIWGLRRLARK
jgi:hypothetical protein